MLLDQTQTIQPKFSRITISIMHLNIFSKQTHQAQADCVGVRQSSRPPPHAVHLQQATDKHSATKTSTTQYKLFSIGDRQTHCKENHNKLLQTIFNRRQTNTVQGKLVPFSTKYFQWVTDKNIARKTRTNQYKLFSMGDRQTQCKESQYHLVQTIFNRRHTNTMLGKLLQISTNYFQESPDKHKHSVRRTITD